MQKISSWDLSDLFLNQKDPKIELCVTQAKEKASAFSCKYKGNMLKIDEYALLGAIKEYEVILSEVFLPYAFAELIYTTDAISPENGAFLQKVKSEVTEIYSQLIFFELEIGNLLLEKDKELIENEIFSNYKHYFEKILAQKKHRLSEAEEKVAELKSLTGRQAINRLFEQELSGSEFAMEIDGQDVKMTQSEILNILYANGNQKNRKAAAKSFTDGLLKKESIFTFVTNTLAEDKKIDDKLRNFTFPEQSRHLQNEAEHEDIEAMCQAVEENYKLVQQYYDFKKQALGLEEMFDYDRYAPLVNKSEKYSFEEAKEMILAAFGEFDKEFEKIARDFFEKKWIDAQPQKGKRGGAYCECATPTMHPYVFMNFTGSANDVMTLAHELGHAIHFELMRKHSFANFTCPLTLAETASIFAETLVFQKMVSQTEDKEVLFGLYMQRIEGIFSSVFRQVSMYRFEQDFHSEYRKNGELEKEQINQLWKKRQEEMFGNSIILTPEYDNWWMYIPHFLATPFYVYAYAFGELLSFGILEKIKLNKEMIPVYKEFLTDAGFKSPQQLAELFDIDLKDKHFWASGIHIIEEYFEKIKSLKS